MLSVWVIFKIGDRLVDTCDALSGQLAVYWVGRSDSNSRATFFPQSAPAQATPLEVHILQVMVSDFKPRKFEGASLNTFLVIAI